MIFGQISKRMVAVSHVTKEWNGCIAVNMCPAIANDVNDDSGQPFECQFLDFIQ